MIAYTYHRFSPNAITRHQLVAQCEYFLSHHRLLTADDAVSFLCSQTAAPPTAAIITIDDGYREVFDVAYPICHARQIPFTVFLPTSFIAGEMLWFDEVRCLLLNTDQVTINMVLPCGNRLVLSLNPGRQRLMAIRKLIDVAISLPNDERLQLIHMLRYECRTSARTSTESFNPLTTAQILEMKKNGMSIGAHTRTHPILSKVLSDQALADEIVGSKVYLESLLQDRVRHFAYPNGTLQDINDRVVTAVRSAGFQSGWLNISGYNSQHCDLFRLKRIGIDPDWPPSVLKQLATSYMREAGVSSRYNR